MKGTIERPLTPDEEVNGPLKENYGMLVHCNIDGMLDTPSPEGQKATGVGKEAEPT